MPTRPAVASPSLGGRTARLCQGLCGPRAPLAPAPRLTYWESDFQGTVVSHGHTEPAHSEKGSPPSRLPSPKMGT